MRFGTAARRRRKGGVSLFLVLALFVLLAVLALAINVAYLDDTRQSVENVADAAALAGARELVADSLLTGDANAFVSQIQQARTAAVTLAAANPVLGQPLTLDPNTDNLAGGDVVFGTIDMAAPSKTFVPGQQLTDPASPSLPLVNAVRITPRRSTPLLLGQLLVQPSADVGSIATALVDRDVIGFRPVLNQPLPLVPIALLSDPSGNDADSWEAQVPGRQGTDDYRFDPTTQTFVADPTGDGLHEMQVTLGDNAALVEIGVASTDAAGAQVAGGITPTQLQALGGQLVLGSGGQLTLPAATVDPTTDLTAVQNALEVLQQRGELRVWLLSTETDGANGQATVTGFVAARVVQVTPAAAGQPLRFILQPGMLVTAAAVTDATRRGQGVPPLGNPYVCKIRLVE